MIDIEYQARKVLKEIETLKDFLRFYGNLEKKQQAIKEADKAYAAIVRTLEAAGEGDTNDRVEDL